MPNRLFDAESLRILENPGQWKLISTSLPREVSPADQPRHQRWMQKHQHTHAWPEFGIALKGHTYYGIADQIYPCRPGYVFFIKPQEPHDCGVPHWSPPVTHLWIKLMFHRITATLFPNEAPTSRHPVMDNFVSLPDTTYTFQKILTALNRGFATGAEIRRSQLVTAAFVALAQVIEAGYQPANIQVSVKLQQKLLHACESIAAQSGKGISIAQLTEMVGCSRFHLMRAFKRHVGLSVHAFVDVCRLAKATELSRQGLPDKAIAAELGFACPATFSRWLAQKRHQTTPMCIASPYNKVLLMPAMSQAAPGPSP